MAKKKYYVVWNGVEDGVYTTWEACQQAVEGFPAAKYKSFKTESEAEEAFEMGYDAYMQASAETAVSTETSVPSPAPVASPAPLPQGAINESGVCSDIIRAPDCGMYGSGMRKVSEYFELNFCAKSLVSSICCFWSSPTGTISALYISISDAIKTG